jgi:outer membrane protein assembly factor BamB
VVVGDTVFYTHRADDGKVAAEAVTGNGRASLQEEFAGDKKRAVYLDKEGQAQSKLKAQATGLDVGNGFIAGAPAAANPETGKDNIGRDNVSSLQAFQGSRVLYYWDNNFNCIGDEVVCSDPQTGKREWSFKLEGDLKKDGGFLAAPPAAAGGELFLATLKGEVLRVDPEKRKITATYKVGGPLRFQPAVEGGKIYVGTQDGKLVWVDAGDKKFTGWPCRGGNAAHTGLRSEKTDK